MDTAKKNGNFYIRREVWKPGKAIERCAPNKASKQWLKKTSRAEWKRHKQFNRLSAYIIDRWIRPDEWDLTSCFALALRLVYSCLQDQRAMKNEKRKGKIHNSNAWCHMEWVEYRVRFERFAYIFRCWAFFLVIDGFTWDESKQFSKIYECLKYRLTWLLWSLRYF